MSSVLPRQTVELQPKSAKQEVALSDGKIAACFNKKEKKKEHTEKEKEKEMTRNKTMAKNLAEYNEGKCKPDITLRPISTTLEQVLYHNSKTNSDGHRPHRYASYIFRYLVPYEIYCNWVKRVNYTGAMGKEALPKNLRKAMRMYIERRFPGLPCDCWREIRDVINELLRVRRKPSCFHKFYRKIAVHFDRPVLK
ncbi:protein Pat-like [Dunckerocampus dactyliophorus]|uniref:protein Pat-like n=1 Tax=Dunckerocampus dactyliophorus TaxID=161453 RepID=UPI002404BDA4|nr:protein Pat-like [Dunckerocampus dactyliophorus]